MVRELGDPQEVELAGRGVDGTDGHLQQDVGDAAPGHGDAPVIGAVVDHEELPGREKNLFNRTRSRVKITLE